MTDCPGYYLLPDEGDKHGLPHCPWGNGNAPEGQMGMTRDEFCAHCKANQLRADVVNVPEEVPEIKPPFVCGLTGEATAPGLPCVVDRCCVICGDDCESWEGE
jgi:hypothetical protein